MKWLTLLLVFVLCSLGCQLRYREQEVANRQAALDQKEKELVLKETALELKEAELLRREYQLDSLRLRDTAYTYDPKIVGEWTVKMQCTETTCASSAVGDTKTETWAFSYLEDALIAKAMAGNHLVRVYTGKLSEGNVELTAEVEASAAEPATTIQVQLTMADGKTMEGQRQIVRGNDCKIVYDLQLSKQ